MYPSHEPDDLLPCDACDAYGQCEEHLDPYSDEFDYDDPYDVVMYDIDVEEDDLYALIDMLGDTTRSWYARRRLNALAASGPLRALVADIIIDSLGRRWNPLEHPRDRFGRFINTGGFFRWLDKGGDWLRGRVERIDSDGVIHARSVGNDRVPDGQLVRFKPEESAKLVSVANPLADLTNGPEFEQKFALDLDADIPDFPEASPTQKRMYNALRDGNMPAEDLDRFLVSSDELTPADFTGELRELEAKGLVEIDSAGTRPRIQRTDLPEADDIDAEVLDGPEDDAPELEDSPNLTKQQRDLIDFITEVDRGEGDGVAFEELDNAAEEDIQALVEAGVLDDDGGRLHLVNPEEGISDLNAPEVPVEEDLIGEIMNASEVIEDPAGQEAFQHYAMALADPGNEDNLPLPDDLPAGKRRNAEQAANRWWAERNGGETPDPNLEEANPDDVLNPRNQAMADGLAEQWFNGDDAFLDSTDGVEYRGALKNLFDAADLEENDLGKQAGVKRMQAERAFNRLETEQAVIDGWPAEVQNVRENGLEAPTPDVAPEEVVPEDVVPEDDDGQLEVDNIENRIQDDLERGELFGPEGDAEDVAPEAPVMLRDRPGWKLFARQDPDAQELLDFGASEYEWGALAGEKDMAAGLPEMSDDDHWNVWGADSPYAEGYRDAYAENVQPPDVPREPVPDIPRRAMDDPDNPAPPAPVTPDSAVDLALEDAAPEVAPDVSRTPTNDDLDEAIESGDFPDVDVDRDYPDLDQWIEWQRRVAARRDPDGDFNDELIREKAIADNLGLDLFRGDGLMNWTSFIQKENIDGPEAEELYRRHQGQVGMAAMERVMNRVDADEADLALAEAESLNVDEVDLPDEAPSMTPDASPSEVPIADVMDLAAAEFVPDPRAIVIDEAPVPELDAINNQKPFNIDDYPYITEDGMGLVNRQGKLVGVGQWFRANRGGEGDPDEVVGFYEQEHFPGWVLVRAPDGKLKGAHVLGQGKTNLGGLNHRAEPPGKNPGEIAEWRAQRAARGGDRLDNLDQNNPVNVLRPQGGERGDPGGERAEVGKAVHYVAPRAIANGEDWNGVISRIGWDGGAGPIGPDGKHEGRPVVFVLVPGRKKEIGIAPAMLEPRVDPVTERRPPTPDVNEVSDLLPRREFGAPELPDREWQIPNDNGLIDRMDEAADADGFIDYVKFVNAFVNPGVVAGQIDGLVDAGDPRFVRGAGPNGRPALKMGNGAIDAPEIGVPEVALPEGAENAVEGVILDALDNAGSAGLPRGGLIDIDNDDVTNQIDALKGLQERGIIERADGPDGKPIFKRVDTGPQFADGAENEIEGGLLDIVDGLDGGARGSDLMDADADDLEDKVAALRALVDRGVLRRVPDENGKPVYRRPSTNSNAPTPMSDEEAQAALRGGADPFMVANSSLDKALKAAGFQFVPNGEARAANAGSPNNWVISPEKGEFPVELKDQGPVEGKVYMVKKTSGDIANDVLNEVMSGAISEDLREKLGQDATGLLYHPRVGIAQAPKGVGKYAGGAIIMDHAAYGYPEGHKFYSGVKLGNDDLRNGNATSDIIGLALYDYLINNHVDRHRNNQLYAKDPNTGEIRAVIIDNGFAFGAGAQGGYVDPENFQEYAENWRPGDLLRRVEARAEDRAAIEKAVRDFAVVYQNIDVDSIMARIKAIHPTMSPEQEAYVMQWLATAKTRSNEIALDIDAVVDIIMGI